MALPKIHTLNFSWSAPTGITFTEYIVDVIINDSFSTRIKVPKTNTSLTIDELVEGDEVFLEITPSDDGALHSDNLITTATQSVPVQNFGNLGQDFSFMLLYVNGSPDLFSNITNGKYYIDASYIQKETQYGFDITNPRDSSALIPGEEPYFSHFKYHAYTPTGTLLTGITNSPSLTINNNYNVRDYTLEFAVHDVYGGSITGVVNASKPIPSILSETFSFTNTTETGKDFSIFVNPSHKINYFDYVFYDDSTFTNVIQSGYSDSQFSTQSSLPNDLNAYLKITPYDWFGSGTPYYKTDPVNTVVDTFVVPNEIDDIIVNDQRTGIHFQPNVTIYNDVGSYISYSIDPSNTGSYNQDSYATGYKSYIDSQYSPISFHSFVERTGVHEDFFYTIKLQRSGNNFVEDMETGMFSCPYPKFVGSGINFDYTIGATDLIGRPNYATDTDPPTVYIEYKGTSDSTYAVSDGDETVDGELYSQANFRLVDAFNSSIIYDQLYITGSPQRPSLRTQQITSPAVEGSVNMIIGQASDTPVLNFTVYRKPAIKIVEGFLPPHLSGILNFNDYENHYYESDINLGNYYDMPPDTIPARNTTLEYNQNGYSGKYETGKHYIYRFVPHDGYGSGHASLPSLLTFGTNQIAQATDSELVTTEGRVTTAEEEIVTTVNKVDNLSGRVSALETGVAYLTGEVNGLEELYDHIHYHVEGLLKMETGISYLTSGYSGLQTNFNSLETGVQYLETGVYSLETGVQYLNTGINPQQDSRIYSLETGVYYLNTGINPQQDSRIHSLETGVQYLNTGINSQPTAPTLFPSNIVFGNNIDIINDLEATKTPLYGVASVDAYVMPTSGYIGYISTQYYVGSIGSTSNNKAFIQAGIDYADTTGIISKTLTTSDEYTYIRESMQTYIPFTGNSLLSAYAYVNDINISLEEISVLFRIYTP